MLIWPPDFSVSIHDELIKITDPENEVVSVTIGSIVQVSGGEVTLGSLSDTIRNSIPEKCSEPYWLVGNIVK